MGEYWKVAGRLPENFRARTACATGPGAGIVGGMTQNTEAADLSARLLSRRALLYRIRDRSLDAVFEAPGYIQVASALDSVCYAVHAQIKPAGAGSDYFLIRSIDRGERWSRVGPIPALSVEQILIVDANEVWIFGASGTLMYSSDGGAKWLPVSLDFEATWTRDRLVRLEDSKAAIAGRGLMAVADAKLSTWRQIISSEVAVQAACDPYFVAEVSGRPGVWRRNADRLTLMGQLPNDILGVELVVFEDVIRVLARGRSPDQGARMMILRSEDQGRSWNRLRLDASAVIDIAGSVAGIGVETWQNRVIISTAESDSIERESG